MSVLMRHALWVALVWSSAAHADNLKYSRIDDATVRVLAFKGITLAKGRADSGKRLVVAVPDAGHGSGLLVSADGLILTARHVIEDATIIAVLFPGQENAVPAKVVYADEERDHAFLAVAGQHKAFVPIPKSPQTLSVRDKVFVVGYPLDASRNRPQSQQGIISGVLKDDSLQLGVALNPGNSGGPVVDDKENLLGIAVARADPRAGAQGIGVAVPIEHIMSGYERARKSSELSAARKELASGDARAEQHANLLVAMLAAEDSDNTWQALDGKRDVPPASESVAKRLDAAFKSKEGPSAEVLLVAAAEQWNTAAVLEERGQESEVELGRAREFAQRALDADGSLEEKSPFLTFVREGRSPTDAQAPLPEGARTSDEADGEVDPTDMILNSLETSKSLPTLRWGLTAGITTPFQIFGLGATIKLLAAEKFSLQARYHYGWHRANEEFEGSHLLEALGGFVLSSWQGKTTAQLVVDVEHMPNATVYRYIPGEIPTTHTLVLEAGILSGPVNLGVAPTEPDLTLFGDQVTQIYVLQGGIRYTYFYQASSEYLATTARSTVELSAHAMAPPLGIPDHRTNADGAEIKGLPGVKGEVAWGSAPLSWGLYELGIGYFPAADWIYFRLGWTFLFY